MIVDLMLLSLLVMKNRPWKKEALAIHFMEGSTSSSIGSAFVLTIEDKNGIVDIEEGEDDDDEEEDLPSFLRGQQQQQRQLANQMLQV